MIAWGNESNDDFSSANPINRRVYSWSTSTSADHDYYQINLATDGILTVEAQLLEEEPAVELT